PRAQKQHGARGASRDFSSGTYSLKVWTTRVLAALVSFATARAMGQQWLPLGPAPINDVQYTGRISAIATSSHNASLFYVGGADGGVWRTMDGGASWMPMTDALPTSAIGALAIHPQSDE